MTSHRLPAIGLVLLATVLLAGCSFRRLAVNRVADAAAAYGSFIIPTVFKSQIKPGAVTVENALYGFAAFYLLCLVLNWWYYVRRDAEVRC